MIRVVHTGSRIPDPDADFQPIPDPGSRIQGSKRHRIPDNCQPPPTPWIPPHTRQLQGDLPTPLTHNNTQHYTTALRYIKHKNRLFWAQMALASLVPFQGPKKSRFSGPTPSNAPHNDVAPLKIITYRAIKTTGTLIVSNPLDQRFQVQKHILTVCYEMIEAPEAEI